GKDIGSGRQKRRVLDRKHRVIRELYLFLMYFMGDQTLEPWPLQGRGDRGNPSIIRLARRTVMTQPARTWRSEEVDEVRNANRSLPHGWNRHIQPTLQGSSC